MAAAIMSRYVSFISSPFKNQNKDQIAPPVDTTPKKEDGQFVIKVQTNDQFCQKFTGYSQESDIIPLTVDFCEKHKARKGIPCTPPIVTTSTEVNMANTIVVDNWKSYRTWIHFIKK